LKQTCNKRLLGFANVLQFVVQYRGSQQASLPRVALLVYPIPWKQSNFITAPPTKKISFRM
jgi:hypothetical protein